MFLGPVVSSAQSLSFQDFIPNPSHIEADSASATSIAGLGELVSSTLGSAFPNTYKPADERVYVVVHLLRWSDPVKPVGSKENSAAEQHVQFSRWYVYSNDGTWT